MANMNRNTIHQRATVHAASVQAATGSLMKYESAAEVPKETAASFTYREFQEIVDRMTIVSNRLSAAKKRLQEHFGMPVTDSATAGDSGPIVQPGMDGVRTQLDSLDGRFQSIASGIEELV
jgi:hypothetical protein